MLNFIPYQDFTIAVLLYGDHTDLAHRCLDPILEIDEPYNLFVIMNAVCPETRKFVRNIPAKMVVDNPTNNYKYPELKKIIPCVNSNYLMWFDDDSYIKQPKGFLSRVREHMTADMIGWIYEGYLRGKQDAWLKRQPWYEGKKLAKPTRFIHGSWWTATKQMLVDSGWPWKDVRHRGGDIALGLWMEQQERTMREYQDDIVFNMAARRGYDEQPVGFLG